MTPQEYIQSQLDALKEPAESKPALSGLELEEAIFRAVMSKKFRKYAAAPHLVDHINSAIHLQVSQGEPINFLFPHGAYKLWRLEESPEPDWAELFALMYYTKWTKTICDFYAPGVWFDFFVDDLIVPKIDNIPLADVRAYLETYQLVFDFLRPYQPRNLKMTFTTVGSRFESPAAFDASLKRSIAAYTAGLPHGLPELSDADRASVELNTKVTPEQSRDPQWREKVMLIHNAYMTTKAEPGYHKNRPDKIGVFSMPLPAGTYLPVGTTKDSIAKFWVGVGALKPQDGSYRQLILTPKQLAGAKFDPVPVEIPGLEGKNFHSIRVLNG